MVEQKHYIDVFVEFYWRKEDGGNIRFVKEKRDGLRRYRSINKLEKRRKIKGGVI